MVTYQEARDRVRTFLDTDSTDLIDALLDLWGQEALDMIGRRTKVWPFQEADYTFNTVASTQSYSLSAFTPGTCRDIDTIRGPQWVLRWVDHREAQDAFEVPSNVTGQPTHYSIWKSQVYLWPIPDAAYAMKVRGYDKIDAWLTGGASTQIDLPTDFHSPVVNFMLSRAHMFYDDPTLGQYFMGEFERELERLARSYLGEQTTAPLIVNAKPTLWDSNLPDRGRFPFD